MHCTWLRRPYMMALVTIMHRIADQIDRVAGQIQSMDCTWLSRLHTADGRSNLKITKHHIIGQDDRVAGHNQSTGIIR